jgi:hypothetical protein
MVQLLHRFHPSYLAANALELAAERGDTPLFQWLYEHRPKERDYNFDALIAAAANGGLAIVRYLLEEADGHGSVVCPPVALRSAVEHGHCDIAQYLTDRGVRAQLTGLDSEVARRGHLEMAQWLHSTQLPGVFTTAAMDAAAGAGHFDIVRFLHENRSEGCRSWAMDGAATGGFLEIVEFLFAHRGEGCTARAVNGAARNGHLHVLQWFYGKLRHKLSIWTSEAATAALVNGHYDALAWLQTHFPHQCTQLPPYAALEITKEGNLRGLKMLHEMHGPDVRWSPRVMEVAAARGDLEMVQWLLANRPNDSTGTAMDRAAETGRLEIVKFLHTQEGVRCTSWAMDEAAAGGYLEVVQWLHENRSEGCTVSAMDMAAAGGHLDVIQWLHTNRHEGCTSHAMDAAAIGSHLEVLVWLHEHRSEGCTIEAMDRAASLDNWEVVQWLAQNLTANGCSPNGLRVAASRGRLRVLQFLQSRFDLHVDRLGVLAAARNGYLDVLQWALADQRLHGEGDLDLAEYRAVAEQHGHFHVVAWLDDHGSS